MKPLQIGLLVIAGALGGAVFMQYTQRPHALPDAPVVAQQQAPPAAPAPLPVEPAPPPPPAPAEAEPVDQKPSPAGPVETGRARKEAPKPKRVPRSRPQPVHVAQNATPAVTAAPAVQPEPVREAPAPPTVPPARTEPEKVVVPAPPPPPPPEPPKVTLNAGMLIPVRLVDGLSSERNMPGDTFTATLDKELVVDGFVIAERGARVDGRVVASDRGGKVKGTAGLSVELTRLRTSDGQTVAIATDSFERQAENTHGTDAAKVGGAAAVGAIIGAIAGGGKGAAIGAGVGGGAGAGDVLLTRGKPAALPSETRISFRLRTPVTITERL